MTQMETQPLLYTAEQASQRLGVDDDGKPLVSAYWLKRKAGKGLIPHTRLGKSAVWSEQDLADLVEQRRKVGPKPRA